MNRDEALQIVNYLGASYRTEVPAETQAVWVEQLRAINAEDGRNAASALVGTAMFMPHPSEFLAAAQEQARARALRHALPAGPKAPCIECDDREWVTLIDAIVPTVRPCSRCLPVQFVRWSEGHLNSRHSCGECAALKGGGAAGREALAAIRERHKVLPESVLAGANEEAF